VDYASTFVCVLASVPWMSDYWLDCAYMLWQGCCSMIL